MNLRLTIAVIYTTWAVVKLKPEKSSGKPGSVVQKVDNAIHLTNHYPVNSVACFVNTYPLDSII